MSGIAARNTTCSSTPLCQYNSRQKEQQPAGWDSVRADCAHQDGLAERVLLCRLHDERLDDTLLDGGAQGRHAAELEVSNVCVRLRCRADAIACLRAAASGGSLSTFV